ncbi:MAG: hypothetical protein R3B54_13360 [Bdellovibrionota bacterium]
MIRHKNLRFTLFLLIVVALASCSRIDDEGFIRCTNGVCTGLEINTQASNLGLSCTATPASSTVNVDQYFNVTLNAQGGATPYYVASTSGAKSFNPSTVLSGRYKTPGTKREYITVYDSSGLSASCPLDVVVQSGAGCDITVANNNYSPAVDEEIQFRFQAYGIETGKLVTYEFIPDANKATNLGYVLTKQATDTATAAFDYKYSSRGVKKPRLYVSTSKSWASCDIAALPVRQPDFEITGKRFADLYDPNQATPTPAKIELEMVDNGEFGGTITYTYDLVETDPNVTLSSDLNEVTVSSETTTYIKVRLKVTAKVGTDGPEVIKYAYLEFVPSEVCPVEIAGDTNGVVIRGDKVSYALESASGGDVVVHDVILPAYSDLVSDRNDDGTYQLPIEVRFRSLGDRKVKFVALAEDTHARCEDANGNDVSATVDVRKPVACVAVADPWIAQTNSEVDLKVEIPEYAGIGPFRINDIRASSGAGFSEVTASRNKRSFDADETGLQVIKFQTGRPNNGITYGVDVEILDEGDPEGRKYECHTTVTSVLPAGQAACTAHFERDGQVITSARTREDGLDLVVNANFTNFGQIYNFGSEVAPSGNLLNHPLPFQAHLRYDQSSNTSSRTANTQIGVWDGQTTKYCTANLSLTGKALSCSIDFPSLDTAVNPSNGFNNTIVISSSTSFPGNVTTDALGKRIVNFTGHVKDAVGTVNNSFDDGNGVRKNFTVSRPASEGIYTTTVNLQGEFTRHGAYGFVRNRITDSYDSTGASCQANRNMYAHLMRSAAVYRTGTDNSQIPVISNDKCVIRVTNITPARVNSTDHTKETARATVWTFGRFNMTGNVDCHRLYSENFSHTSAQATSCTQRFTPINNRCELIAKAVGWHNDPAYAQNPGDFKVEVWVENSSGVRQGNIFRLPNMCQTGSSCSEQP